MITVVIALHYYRRKSTSHPPPHHPLGYSMTKFIDLRNYVQWQISLSWYLCLYHGMIYQDKAMVGRSPPPPSPNHFRDTSME